MRALSEIVEFTAFMLICMVADVSPKVNVHAGLNLSKWYFNNL